MTNLSYGNILVRVFFQSMSNEGSFMWSTSQQGYVLSSFFYGYVITQIPFGILSKKYGAKYFLGVGMLINSVFGFLVPLSANFGIFSLISIRFIQGLGEVSCIQRPHDTTRRYNIRIDICAICAICRMSTQNRYIIIIRARGVISHTNKYI